MGGAARTGDAATPPLHLVRARGRGPRDRRSRAALDGRPPGAGGFLADLLAFERPRLPFPLRRSGRPQRDPGEPPRAVPDRGAPEPPRSESAVSGPSSRRRARPALHVRGRPRAICAPPPHREAVAGAHLRRGLLADSAAPPRRTGRPDQGPEAGAPPADAPRPPRLRGTKANQRRRATALAPRGASAVRAVLSAFPGEGHAFPVIALARELRSRGHEVWFQSAERWRQAAEEMGLEFLPAPEFIAPARQVPGMPTT